jgi:hypothetical protein
MTRDRDTADRVIEALKISIVGITLHEPVKIDQPV